MVAENNYGLRKRPTYQELINEIQLDEKIKLPNRQAKFLRESQYLSFLDGETHQEMQAQEERVQKQVQVEQAIVREAGGGDGRGGGGGGHSIRAKNTKTNEKRRNTDCKNVGYYI